MAMRSNRLFSGQKPLPFVADNDGSLGSFLVSDCNRGAISIIQKGMLQSQGLPLMFVHGGQACGKSHLGRAVADAVAGKVYSASELNIAESLDKGLLQATALCVVDDLQDIFDNLEAQKTLVELINMRRQDRAGHLLFLSRLCLDDWYNSEQLPDFTSRLLGTGQVAEITEPDDQLLSGVLQKLASDRQFRLSAKHLDYCLSRMPRSFAAAQSLVTHLDQVTLSQQIKVGLPSIRLALDALAVSSDQ